MRLMEVWKKNDTKNSSVPSVRISFNADIYVLGLFYSPAIKEERMKHLKGMVHEWSPKEE